MSLLTYTFRTSMDRCALVDISEFPAEKNSRFKPRIRRGLLLAGTIDRDILPNQNRLEVISVIHGNLQSCVKESSVIGFFSSQL